MLDEYMEIIGFNTEQIKILKNTYPSLRYTESTLLYNIKNLHN